MLGFVLSLIWALFSAWGRSFAGASLVGVLLLFPVVAQAEIVKTAVPKGSKIELYTWPKVEIPAGWHFDAGSSRHFGMNALAPDGTSFRNADAVIYARAIHKPSVPQHETLAAFTVNAVSDFMKAQPKANVKRGQKMTTADGKSWVSYIYTPKDSGNWERVAYGEDSVFYVVLVLSARNEQGYDAHEKAFEAMVRNYKQ